MPAGAALAKSVAMAFYQAWPVIAGNSRRRRHSTDTRFAARRYTGFASTTGGIERRQRFALVGEQQAGSIARCLCRRARHRRQFAQKLAVGAVAGIEVFMTRSGGGKVRARGHGLRLEGLQRSARERLGGHRGSHGLLQVHGHYGFEIASFGNDRQSPFKTAANLAGNTEDERGWAAVWRGHRSRPCSERSTESPLGARRARHISLPRGAPAAVTTISLGLKRLNTPMRIGWAWASAANRANRSAILKVTPGS